MSGGSGWFVIIRVFMLMVSFDSSFVGRGRGKEGDGDDIGDVWLTTVMRRLYRGSRGQESRVYCGDE